MPLFDLGSGREPRRLRAWAASVAVQALLLAAFVGALQRAARLDERRLSVPDTGYVYLVPGPDRPPAPLRAGPRQPAALPRVEPVTMPPDTASPVPTAPPAPRETGIPGRIVPGPALGDGSMWVSPRPALPAAVADELYGAVDPAQRDSVVKRRLRAMVDSLNRLLDEEQRAQRLPDWTVGADGGPKWGIDPEWIYLGDIKIPTPVLALLGNLLPAGDYDQAQRARHLADVRQDIMYSAARAQTFQDFRRYVRETRERRQRERDEARRKAEQDTVRVIP